MWNPAVVTIQVSHSRSKVPFNFGLDFHNLHNRRMVTSHTVVTFNSLLQLHTAFIFFILHMITLNACEEWWCRLVCNLSQATKKWVTAPKKHVKVTVKPVAKRPYCDFTHALFPKPVHCGHMSKKGVTRREMPAFQCACASRSPLETVPPPQEIRASQGATCTGRFVSNPNKNQNSQMGRRASH